MLTISLFIKYLLNKFNYFILKHIKLKQVKNGVIKKYKKLL